MKVPRQKAIINLIKKSKFHAMSTAEIAEKFGVTQMTIRRDLNNLAKLGLLKRTYGGAFLTVEKNTNEKIQIQHEAKMEIGEEIGKLIQPNTTIYLGAGTTVFAATKFLPLHQHVNYVTNSDLVFHFLAEKDVPVMLTGGLFQKSSDQFLGTIAIESIKNYYFDQVFIGTNGIYQGQATTSTLNDSALKKTTLKHSKAAYIVADHTKIGIADPYLFATLTETNGIIVDSKINDTYRRELNFYSRVIIASKNEKI